MLDAILAQSRNTALIMGLIALIGLLLQKKSATDVMSGTMKTVIGFMVFNIGSNAMSAVITTFNELFNTGFGINAVSYTHLFHTIFITYLIEYIGINFQVNTFIRF